MPLFSIRSLVNNRIYVPPPVNRFLKQRGSVTLPLNASDVESSIRLRQLIDAEMITIEVAENPQTSNVIEIAPLAVVADSLAAVTDSVAASVAAVTDSVAASVAAVTDSVAASVANIRYGLVTTGINIQASWPEHRIIHTTANGVVVTLPTGASAFSDGTTPMFTVKHVGPGSSSVIVSGGGTIDGEASVTILQFSTLTVYTDGSQWYIE